MKKALVVGAEGAIGQALVAECRKHGWSVTALGRAGLDLTSEQSIASCAKTLSSEAPYQLLLIATGVLHDDQTQPEKALRSLSAEQAKRTFEINSLGPALVIQSFLPLLCKKNSVYIGVLSARVGSISDNRLGGWYSYRASKSALNMFLKTISIELARTHPNVILSGLHPGTVDSRLSAPFQSHVPTGKLFSPSFAAKKLYHVLTQLAAEDSGYCFAWDGQRIPF